MFSRIFFQRVRIVMCAGMTQDHARRIQKHRHVKCADGISPPTSFGELMTADRNILNLGDESRNDHRNALIGARRIFVSNMKFLRNTKRCGRHSIVLAEIPASNPKKTGRACPHRLVKELCVVRTYKGLTIRILLVVQKPTG